VVVRRAAECFTVTTAEGERNKVETKLAISGSVNARSCAPSEPIATRTRR